LNLFSNNIKISNILLVLYFLIKKLCVTIKVNKDIVINGTNRAYISRLTKRG